MQTTQTDGPDYVALIIEWDDEVPTLLTKRAHRTPRALIQVASAALAGLGAIALAAWGAVRGRATS